MRISRHILSAILILAMLSTGLPIFSPGDANRDSRVNLEDAILQVKDFVRTAETPAAFTSKIRKALSTLHVVAGLKTDIKPVKDAKSSNSLPALNPPYLINSITLSTPSSTCSQVSEQTFHYESILFPPTTPPPQFI